jgi:hypothetical protein
MFSLFKNNQAPYSVQRIEKGELLDKATLATVHAFFNDWINKRPRKARVGCWFVLYENESFVYWGMPVFKGISSNNKTVEVFYKTSKTELDKQFPLYKKNYQDFVWQRLYAIIKQETIGIVTVRRDKALKGFIKDNQLHIEVSCSLIYPKKEGAEFAEETKAQYDIVLDNKTMGLIAIKQQKK